MYYLMKAKLSDGMDGGRQILEYMGDIKLNSVAFDMRIGIYVRSQERIGFGTYLKSSNIYDNDVFWDLDCNDTCDYKAMFYDWENDMVLALHTDVKDFRGNFQLVEFDPHVPNVTRELLRCDVSIPYDFVVAAISDDFKWIYYYGMMEDSSAKFELVTIKMGSCVLRVVSDLDDFIDNLYWMS